MVLSFAGLQGVWVNRSRRTAARLIAPTWSKSTTLSDLPAALGSMA